jgi:hypothetical protein
MIELNNCSLGIKQQSLTLTHQSVRNKKKKTPRMCKDILYHEENINISTFEKGKLQTLFVKKQLLQACHEKCIDDETSL